MCLYKVVLIVQMSETKVAGGKEMTHVRSHSSQCHIMTMLRKLHFHFCTPLSWVWVTHSFSNKNLVGIWLELETYHYTVQKGAPLRSPISITRCYLHGAYCYGSFRSRSHSPCSQRAYRCVLTVACGTVTSVLLCRLWTLYEQQGKELVVRGATKNHWHKIFSPGLFTQAKMLEALLLLISSSHPA